MVEPDPFTGQDAGVLSIGKTLELITPSDVNALPKWYRYILCGGTGGAVAIKDQLGTSATLYVNAGEPLRFRPWQILSTGTVATPLYGVL